MRWWIGCALAVLGASCAEEVEPELAPTTIRVVPRPDIAFSGCRDRKAGACLLKDDQPATLRIWIDTQQYADFVVTADGLPLAAEIAPASGGLRVTITVAPDVRHLQVMGADPTWSQPWELSVVRLVDSPTFVRAEALRRGKGDLAGAKSVIVEALPGLDGADRLAALEWLASAEGTAERRRDVIALADALDRPRAMGRAADALFHELAERGDLDALEPLVQRLERAGALVDEVELWALRARGHWALRLGNASEAIRSAEAAARLADRLGQPAALAASLGDLIGSYVTTGDWDRLLRRTAQLEPLIRSAGLPCEQQRAALNSIGWAHLRAATAGRTGLWADAALESALALAGDDGACPSAHEEANIRINLALSALQQGDPAYALHWLETVRDPPADLRPWVRDVRARAGLALERLEHVPSPLRGVDDSRADDRYNAWVRQARVSEYLGASTAAADAWAQAEAIVDRQAAMLDVGGSRDHYVEGRLASASGLVRSLVRARQTTQALCRARLARGRLLRLLDHSAALSRAGPDERERWQAHRLQYAKERASALRDADDDALYSQAERQVRVRRRHEVADQRATAALDLASRSLHRRRIVARCEDLPPTAAGTVQLVFFPDDDGWWIFAADDRGADVARAATLPQGWSMPDDLARRVAKAVRVRVLPTGAAWRLHMPSIVAGAETLLDRAPIEHALDLHPRDPPSSKVAVIVANPTGDLEHAQREAGAVAASLRRQGWRVDTLLDARATRSAVMASVANAALLHYGGHGRRRGDAGWDSALLLHNEQALTVQDVLLLPQVPALVVLTGCQTGAADADMLAGGMSLGRAFVLAGASVALVASTEVSDELAQHVGEALYATPGGGAADLAGALRQVQLGLRATQPDSDWSAFRVIVP